MPEARWRAVAPLWLAGCLLAGAAGAAERAELGQKAPLFSLPGLDGKSVRLEEFRGRKGVLLNFWATWCAPCREEMPTLERLARERAHSLAVLAISVDVVGKEQVQAFARELGLSLTILLDTEGLAVKLYRVRGIPSTFIVDRAGVLRYREIGYRDWTTAESRAIVDGALRPR